MAIMESLIRCGITAWLDSMDKMALKVIVKKEYEPIQSLYEQAVMK